MVLFSAVQQSKQVRRISDDDAAAASHTAQAVSGDLPLSSAAAGTDRDPTARAEPASSNSQPGNAISSMQSKPPSQLSKPKVPAVLVKPKAPALVVRAKRKADDADESSLLPDKKQHQNGGSDPGASGLAGLAAYGSDSGSGSPSDS